MKKLFTATLMLAAMLCMNAQTPVYILGEIGDQTWNPNVGTQMTFTGNNTYVYEGHINSNSYFSFTTMLDPDWEVIAPYRFAAVEGHTEIAIGEALPLSEVGVSEPAFTLQLVGGNYRLTLDLDARTLTVTEGEAEDYMYVIGSAFGNWDPTKGMALAKTGDVYTGEASFDDTAYFIFSDVLAGWDIVNNGHRYSPLDGNAEVLPDAVTPTQLSTNSGAAYYIGAGNYDITFDKENGTFVFASKGGDAGAMYIIGSDPAFGEWNPEESLKMMKNGDIYISNVALADTTYFVFSDIQAGWESVNNGHRYSPLEENTQVYPDVPTATQISYTESACYYVEPGNYEITFDKANNTFTFTSTEDAMYIIGSDIAFGEWDPTAGMKMDKIGDVYIANVELSDTTYFIFSDVIADWDMVNAGHRFSPLDGNALVMPDTPTETQLSDNSGAAYYIEPGKYIISFDKLNGNFIFSAGDTVDGDADGNGRLDIDDLNLVINIMLSKVTEYPGTADVNDDGKIDIDDVNFVISCLLKKA